MEILFHEDLDRNLLQMEPFKTQKVIINASSKAFKANISKANAHESILKPNRKTEQPFNKGSFAKITRYAVWARDIHYTIPKIQFFTTYVH